jgi:glycosyltransferase involved in cell wall biosynthesis
MNNKVLAIFSPNENAYSETFIKAHKNLLFNIKYYYGGYLPTMLEGDGSILNYSRMNRVLMRFNNKFCFEEQCLIDSLKKQKVDCVLAEYGPTACAVLTVVRELNIPMIVHFHGYDASVKSLITSYSEKYKDVFRYASKIIVVSKMMKKSLLELGCAEHKIILNCYGPHDHFFEIAPYYNSVSFIAIGRFVDKKAPYLTLAAFKKVVTKIASAKLIMVGDGPLLNACKNLAVVWGLTNAVEFKGVQSRDEINLLLKESIAFVQHSIVADNGDSEGTPLSVLEAQAAGLPVIATFHAGIPDVVRDQETGLLVKEFDVDGMAENMIRVLEEKGLAQKLGKAGKVRIRANFTMKKQLGLLNIIINDAIFSREKYEND